MRYFVATCFLLTCLVAATAQETPQGGGSRESPAAGVTVEGVGVAKLAADMLEYRGMMLLGGTTLADVMQEYDRAGSKLSKALDQFGKGVTFEMRGAMVSSMSENQFRQRQQQAMRYGQDVPQKCVVKDYVTIRVPIEGMQAKEVRDLVVALLEVSAEVDLKDPSDNYNRYDPWGRPLPSDLLDGWAPGMSFALREPANLYSAAVKEALNDAKAKADVQARLAGGALGKVVGVDTMSGGNVSPAKVRDMQHRVVLRVRYELARSN